MTTTPDPQVVREIARQVISAAIEDRTSNALNCILEERGLIESAWAAGYTPWHGAVAKAIAEIAASWPDEQPQDEQDALAEARAERDAANERAEAAERALEEMRGRDDVMGYTRAEIAHELRDARRWHPDNAAWTQDMDQAARIVEIGMDGYAEENQLPRLGGFVREPRVGSEQKASDDA